jgi:hypothetical protein
MPSHYSQIPDTLYRNPIAKIVPEDLMPILGSVMTTIWSSIKTSISNHPDIVAMLGLAGTVASIALAVVLYKLGKPRRLLAYATRTFRVISDRRIKLARLEVLYNTYPVDSLSVTRIAMWNAGNESLRRADIPKTDPPVIYARDEITLFEGTVIESVAANNVSLIPVFKPITGYAVDFEFLDPGDGAVFSIVHAGSKIKDIRVNGEIIGGRVRRTVAHGERPEAQDRDTLKQKETPQSGRKQIRQAALPMVGLCWIVGLIAIFLSHLREGLLLIMVGTLVPGWLLFLSRRVYPPIRLKTFDDNLNVQ